MLGFSNNIKKGDREISDEVLVDNGYNDEDEDKNDNILRQNKTENLFCDDNIDDDNNDDFYSKEYLPQRKYLDDIQRFEGIGCIPGTNANRKSKVHSTCKWDDFFDSECIVSNPSTHSDSAKNGSKSGLKHLLCLFEDENEQEDVSYSSGSVLDKENVDVSCLSQNAQEIAKRNISLFSTTEKAGILKHSCPNWQENVCFALLQKDPDDIKIALENVIKSKERIHAIKQRFLEAWEKKNVALDLFETVLVESASRFKSGETLSQSMTNDKSL